MSSEKFPQWTKFSRLEHNTKYCIVDTVILLPLYWKNPEVIADVKRVASNSTLILLDSVVGETRLKYDGLEDDDVTTDKREFISTLSDNLKSSDFELKFVKDRREIDAMEKKIVAEKIHTNLSSVDYTVLAVAKILPDADVITLDGGLMGSINKTRSKNDKGKTPFLDRYDYHDRRRSTAWFIKRALGSIIHKSDKVISDDLRTRTEFKIKDKKIASVDYQKKSAFVDLLPLTKKRNNEISNMEIKLKKQIKEHFFQWEYHGARKGSKKIAAQKKRFYRKQKRDDDYAY